MREEKRSNALLLILSFVLFVSLPFTHASATTYLDTVLSEQIVMDMYGQY